MSVTDKPSGSAPAGCTCKDWQTDMDKINAPIVLAQVRNPHLTGTDAFRFIAWRFCPWCGKSLTASESPTLPTQPEMVASNPEYNKRLAEISPSFAEFGAAVETLVDTYADYLNDMEHQPALIAARQELDTLFNRMRQRGEVTTHTALAALLPECVEKAAMWDAIEPRLSIEQEAAHCWLLTNAPALRGEYKTPADFVRALIQQKGAESVSKSDQVREILGD